MRHLERFPLGTPYPEVGARLAQLFDTPTLGGAVVAVDQTMVGPPVVKLLCRSGIDARLSAFTVTDGHVATTDECGDWLVPKKELASTVQVLLQSRRLKVADSLAEASPSPTRVTELLNFKLKEVPCGNDMVAEWRDGPQGDLVFAVAIAAWEGERSRFTFDVVFPPAVSVAPAWTRRC